jgi:hypothetical protein
MDTGIDLAKENLAINPTYGHLEWKSGDWA